jgi:chromosome segregation ATPase
MDRRLGYVASGAPAEAIDAIVATLSTRLDTLLALWQLGVDAQRKAPIDRGKGTPRSARELLPELERELADLEAKCAELRQEAEDEARQASDWEQRAMMALQDAREDLARQALARLQDHFAAGSVQEAEVQALESVRDSYRNAVTAVRESIERLPNDGQ